MKRGVFLVLLLAAGAAAHGFSLASAPLDLRFVFGNPAVTDGRALLRNVLQPVPDTPEAGDLPTYAWRPVTEATFFLNVLLTGRSALGLRLGSLAIHLAAAVLAFLVLRRLAGEGPARWAALFFAVHPLGVQALTYAYQRYVLLEAALAFLSVLLYWKARECGSRTAYVLSLAAGLLAMGSKETAVTLPLALGALEWILRAGEPRKRILARWLPFAAMPLLVAVQVFRAHSSSLTAAGTAGLAEPSGLTSFDYLRIQLPMLVRYAFLSAWPFPMRFHFDRPDPSAIPIAKACLCALGLLALSLWCLLGSRRRRAFRIAFALWLTPFLLESTVFPIKFVGWNYRCYPGLLGFALAFALVAVRLPGILPSAAILLMGFLTVAEARVWAVPDGLSRRDVRTAPRIPYLWGSEGMRALGTGRAASAERMFRQALRPAWKDEKVEMEISRCLALEGRPDAAVRFLLERKDRLGGDPRFRDYLARAYLNLGVAAYRKGDLARAEAAFRRALLLKPEYPLAKQNLEAVLGRKGR